MPSPSLLPYLERIPPLAAYAEELALAVTVVVITYLSLIVGELVPKRLALNTPERIAALIAGAMHGLSVAALPAVRLLALSSDLVLWLLRVKPKREPSVTEEEIKILLEQGTEEGIFEEAEHRFMENILRLADRKVGAFRRDFALSTPLFSATPLPIRSRSTQSPKFHLNQINGLFAD